MLDLEVHEKSQYVEHGVGNCPALGSLGEDVERGPWAWPEPPNQNPWGWRGICIFNSLPLLQGTPTPSAAQEPTTWSSLISHLRKGRV